MKMLYEVHTNEVIIPAPTIVPGVGRPTQTARKLAIVCSKSDRDTVYPALILASAALGAGVETHLFFTFGGLDLITKSGPGVLDVRGLVDQVAETGGHLWACRTSAETMRLDEYDLYDGVEGIISAAEFIGKSDGAQLLYI